MKTKIFIIAIFCLSFFSVLGQSAGSVKGKVVEKAGGLPVPFAHVYVETGGQKHGAITDADGNFHLKTLQPGTHKLHVACMGYADHVLEGVEVLPGRPTFINNIKITDASFVLGGPDGIVVTGGVCERKLIDPMDPIHKYLAAEDFEKMAGNHNVNDIVRTISPEIQVPDNGAGIIVRGARSGSSKYMVDGIIMDASPNVPSFAVNSISVYTGGVPAQYGDITGGIIIIETKSYFDFVAREDAKKKRKKEMEEM
jgi:hypothetical protein